MTDFPPPMHEPPMHEPPTMHPGGGHGVVPGPPRRRSRWWVWLLGATGLVVVSCLGCFGALTWIGLEGPDTAVYTGNAVPQRFVDAMRSTGALDADERLLYFYSDALVDIENGFYFVSDRKVALYARDAAPPLTAVPFAEITGVSLHRNESFFEDSIVYLDLADGTPLSFPVSSEHGGDVKFVAAIEERIDAAARDVAEAVTPR